LLLAETNPVKVLFFFEEAVPALERGLTEWGMSRDDHEGQLLRKDIVELLVYSWRRLHDTKLPVPIELQP
jgi:hypothetical protein